jgi:glycine/D-amino acid oxidase-like deaminating enzyme
MRAEVKDVLRSEVSNNNIECDWQEEGFYHAAADKQSLRSCEDFIDYLEHCQIKHQAMSQQDLEEHLGTSWYQKAVKINEGVLINPAKLVIGLAKSLPKNVTLYENSPVLALS